jgi:hypothetical protein
MKALFTIIGLVFFVTLLLALDHRGMSYQAIIRNSSNNLVINHNVGMQIAILNQDAALVYSETQTPKTNANGLITIQIGDSAGFDTINWANGLYFIYTAIDPTGGTNYTISSTSQLLSVPYALYSANSGNIYSSGINTGVGTSKPNAILDIAGANNWDLVNGNGDVRIGNDKYRLKIGLALGGGGAGAVGIMQQGQNGGYNILSLGAQGTFLLSLNGNSKAVGIGTDNPQGALDITSTTKGFLPPRMTHDQRSLLMPVEGLMIYNTTSQKPNYYNGTVWKNFDGTDAN